MKYFTQYKEKGAEPKEVTKAEAKRLLTGWWNDEALDDIFDNNKKFRLWTTFCEVWTEDENGFVPIAGFYGTTD